MSAEPAGRARPTEPLRHQVVVDGITLTVEEHGQRSQDQELPVVVFLPALGVPLAYYRQLLQAWAERGRLVLGVELRGAPQSPLTDLRRESFGYSQLVRRDLPAVFALEAIADRPVVLVGHSLGGHLALLAAASGSVHPASVVTIATGTSSPASQAGPVGRWRRRIGVRFILTTIGVLGYWPGHRLGFGGRQPKGLMADWAYEARHGRYRLAGDPTDYEAALGELSPPALVVGLAGDPMVPPRAVSHLADRLPAGAEQRQLSGEHTEDHFRWARQRPELLIEEVENWLSRPVPRTG